MKTISIWVPPTNESIAKLRQPLPTRTSDVVNVDMIKSLVKAMELQAQKIDQQQQQIDGLLVKQQQQQQHVAGSNCTNAFDCWTQALERLDEAEQQVKDALTNVNIALNETRTAEDNWESTKSTYALQHAGEIKVFSTDSCPDGWTELSQTQGYLLVGRPEGGKTGTQINTALQNGEKSRVEPHTHGTTLTDNGHMHEYTDPGHTHQGVTDYDGDEPGLSYNNDYGGGRNDHPTSNDKTSIIIQSAKSGIGITVDSSTSEGYPLAYVLLCQKNPATTMHTQKPSPTFTVEEPLKKQQQFGRFAGSKCTTALNCWTEALQRLQEAEQLVNNAVNQTRQAEQNCQTIATNAEKDLTSIATNAEQNFQTTATNAVQKCDAAAANLAQYTSEIASNANLANYLCSLHPTCTNSDAYNAVNPSTDTKKPSSSSILDEF